jgi:hypothetical protein
MRTEPTIKQRRFAVEIAVGRSKRVAYQLSHPEQKMSLRSLRAAAARSARSPVVQAEIRRLITDPVILDTCPQANDPRALIEHAVGCMVRLANGGDAVIALHAAEWLISYADSLEHAPAVKAEADRQQLISELHRLYRKALNPAPLVVEADENESGS